MFSFRHALFGLRASKATTLAHYSTWIHSQLTTRRSGICPLTSNGRVARQPSRPLVTDALPSILLPPFVFTGLLVALWTYKCIMTVLFQDKIIYMPYMPPFARAEKMEDYTPTCQPVQWQHIHIRSLDGTKVALCNGQFPEDFANEAKHVVICYFQGNGSSTPPRLPLLSNVLKSIRAQCNRSADSARFTVVALSYRGYWTSSGRASQRGIELDAQAMLRWVQETYGSNAQLILWGQSIGAGVAATAAANYITDKSQPTKLLITGIILETPFLGIKSMLLALYPQKWLPYRYLWPFLWNHWDSEAALQRIMQAGENPNVFLLPATRDEVVPPGEVNRLERICHELSLPTERKDIIGALHTEATTRRDGQEAVARFIVSTVHSR